MNAKLPLVVTVSLPVAAALVDSAVFICPQGAEFELLEASHDHSVVGSDGSPVTLALTKAPSGTAPASGTALTLTTFDLKSTANTPVTKTPGNGGLVVSASTRRIRPGERVCMDFTGTLTALAGFVLTLVLKQHLPPTNR